MVSAVSTAALLSASWLVDRDGWLAARQHHGVPGHLGCRIGQMVVRGEEETDIIYKLVNVHASIIIKFHLLFERPRCVRSVEPNHNFVWRLWVSLFLQTMQGAVEGDNAIWCVFARRLIMKAREADRTSICCSFFLTKSSKMFSQRLDAVVLVSSWIFEYQKRVPMQKFGGNQTRGAERAWEREAGLRTSWYPNIVRTVERLDPECVESRTRFFVSP